jgi:hypothetical protein
MIISLSSGHCERKGRLVAISFLRASSNAADARKMPVKLSHVREPADNGTDAMLPGIHLFTPRATAEEERRI